MFRKIKISFPGFLYKTVSLRISSVSQLLIALIPLSVSETVMGSEQLSPIPWEFQPQSAPSQGMHHSIINHSVSVPSEQ